MMILIPRKRRIAAAGTRLLAAAVALSALAGCGADDAGRAGEPEVVAGFYPLFELARAVGGERARVTNLTAPGAEPHDLEPTTRDLEALHRADLILYLGDGFQPSIEEVAATRRSAALDLLTVTDAREESGSPDGHEDEGRETEDEHGHDGDPHVWLDPVAFASMVPAVRDRLTALDPDGAQTYEANAAAYVAELHALDEAYRRGLAGCEIRVIVTAHAAFGHLAERYDLRQEAIAGVSPESEPDPARLAALVRLVRRLDITTIFTERLVSPRVTQALAREAGVRTAVLDPIEGLSEEQLRRGEDYASVMRRNLATLRTALRCR